MPTTDTIVSEIDSDGNEITERSTGLRLRDAVLELVYDPMNKQTSFLLSCDDGELRGMKSFPLPDGTILVPVDGKVVQEGFLRVPDNVAAYGTQVELEARVREHIHCNVYLPPDIEALAVAYVFYSWAYDCFDTAPYLHFVGDYGCGKSRALDVVGGLCYKSISLTGGATLSSVFRTVDLYRGTLVLDETDFLHRNHDHHEFMRMLRAGFEPRKSYGRTEGGHENWEVVNYSVFSPKVLAGRSLFPDDALESRCIPVHMQAGLDPNLYPSRVSPNCEGSAAQLRNQLLRWRFDYDPNEHPEPELRGLEGRAQQVYRPLMTAIEGPEIKAALERLAAGHNEEIREARRASPHALVLRTLMSKARGGRAAEMSLMELANGAAGRGVDLERELKPKEVAQICRGFGLEPVRRNNGRYVTFDPTKHPHLLSQYGVTEPAQEATPQEAIAV